MKTLLPILLALIAAPAFAQPRPECGYVDTPPTWAQVTACATVAAGTDLSTDIVIEGLDTTRIRSITVPMTWRYMTIQHVYFPASGTDCPLIVMQKVVKCRNK